MKFTRRRTLGGKARHHRLAEDFRDLSHRILDSSNLAMPSMDFLKNACTMLRDFSGCDAVQLRVRDGANCIRCDVQRGRPQAVQLQIVPCEEDQALRMSTCMRRDSKTEQLCTNVVAGRFDSSSPMFTRKGSFWTGDVGKLLRSLSDTGEKADLLSSDLVGEYPSLAIIPLGIGKETTGLLQLKSKTRYFLTQNDIESYEGIAQTLGIALAHQRAQAALRERIKELTCLYGIAKLVERESISLEETLRGIVELLPPAWQYPEITSAQITLDGRSYSTRGFRSGRYMQTADVIVDGNVRGRVMVVYGEKRPELDEGPFLKEERSLIDTVARQVALITERRQADQERSRLRGQLLHADRLATIGQLAAGVAHELNEPLGNILGFAQLAKKVSNLPDDAAEDLERIVRASLHAREVIKKLMLFARQMPPQKIRVSLNKIVEEGLSFFESRCQKEGIELVCSLSPNLPEITADPAQLNQVLVNLVVNALHAMPGGGRLTVRTLGSETRVSLVVEDTGVGMSEEVAKQIFLPFFTTKDVGEGTGLGLAVVHGIVSSHKGSIEFASELGQGTRFEIQLPVSGPENQGEADGDDMLG